MGTSKQPCSYTRSSSSLANSQVEVLEFQGLLRELNHSVRPAAFLERIQKSRDRIGWTWVLVGGARDCFHFHESDLSGDSR